MTTQELLVFRKPRRRTHLMMSGAYFPVTDHIMTMCGLTIQDTPQSTWTPLSLAGGATKRLRNDLVREMDNNSCKRCTRIALGMLALYISRDNGKAW